MAEKFNWNEYRPTKATWFWSCFGVFAATLLIGFTWGGWVTGGTAEELATTAREEGRAELVASICVDKFLDEPDAALRLADLKDQSQWQRDGIIEEGGWATLASLEEQVADAPELCAERLVDMDIPAANASAAADETAVN